ncbi:flagellar motor protein MotB [Pedobacter sp. HMWF019]|uniref:OmpA family protein n=1 Tax=Pedobacter sp. HMWF019 TaxID=2056856 RepID=UPI000D33EE61|nr:OmpA family protein [Pedobacter sp. HMWF019]PTS95210.1 flagellar motor protein MotB [Pedobacter sp. HMWF019]
MKWIPFEKTLFVCCAAIILLCSTGVVKAQYVIKEADVAYDLYNYDKAIDLYEQAYKKKESLHAAERLAFCNQQVRNYKQAESWYAIAVKLAESRAENVLNYARALQNNSKYSEARVQYLKYVTLNTTVNAEQKEIWLVSCDSAASWMKKPKAALVDNQKILNSKTSDWGTAVYQNGLVFSSDRRNAVSEVLRKGKPFLKFDASEVPDRNVYGWTGNGYLSLYEQKSEDGPVTLFPLHVPTDYHVASASFDANGNEVYFTLTRIPKKGKFDSKRIQTVNIEIYSAKKDARGNWSNPVSFKYNKVNAYSVGDPFLSKDGQVLYFVSNMPGGKGGTDLYYCCREASGDWALPVNMTEMNSEGNERSPAVDQQGNFYFSSDGRIGMGGLDIFKVIFKGDHFGGIENAGYPLNSPQDDFAYQAISADKGYFSSNRLDGLGSDDIYSYVMQTVLAFRLEGVVYKKGTSEPLGDVVVTLQKTGGGNLKVQTGVDGRFGFNLAESSGYGLTGEKTDFRRDSASVSTIGLTTSAVLKQDLYLEMMTLNKAIRLENIYYDFNKANIRQDAARELDKLVKIMKDNPTMWIELGSHTDSRGNEQYNQWLSQRRANSAVQYIIDQGISKNRIEAKGHGESQLLNRCAKGVKCSEDEHQLNRRTEFKIVKY